MGAETTLAPVTAEDVAAARARIAPYVRRTPVMHVEAGQLGGGHPAFWLKLESLQATGAFKARSALNNMLASRLTPAGVCAASGGNHGMAVAWAARMLGVPAAIFVPVTCPEVKLRRLAADGAAVTVAGDFYEESYARAERYAAETGALLVHSFDAPLTAAGAGTVTAEFAEQVPEMRTLLIAVGGGGLLAGTVAALAGTWTRVVAVEPVTSRCLGAALDAGERVEVDVSGPAIDSLGPRRVGRMGFAAAVAHHVPHVHVANEAIVAAQLTAWNQMRVGLEGGGAAALGALLSGAYRPAEGEVVGVLACGGNVDITALLQRAEAAAAA
jgi:threonine dehydratase